MPFWLRIWHGTVRRECLFRQTFLPFYRFSNQLIDSPVWEWDWFFIFAGLPTLLWVMKVRWQSKSPVFFSYTFLRSRKLKGEACQGCLAPQVPYAEKAVLSHPADKGYTSIFPPREESCLKFAFVFLQNVFVCISEWHNVPVFMKYELCS